MISRTIFLTVVGVVALASFTNANELTQTDKIGIVKWHNAYRSNVKNLRIKSTATNMMALVWDDDLALDAMQWADQCPEVHNRGVKEGENIAYVTPSGTFDWRNLTREWFLQESLHYNKDHCVKNEECGHFLQMAWATATKIGCGLKKNCKDLAILNVNDGDVLVCRYDTQVVKNMMPFKPGTVCSDCPSDTTCISNLCVPNGVKLEIMSPTERMASGL